MRLCTIQVIFICPLKIVILNQRSSWLEHVWHQHFDALLIAAKQVQPPSLLLIVAASRATFSHRILPDEVEMLLTDILDDLSGPSNRLFYLL